MLKWTVIGQRGVGGGWRQTTDESACCSDKPKRRRPSRVSDKQDKENSGCVDVTPVKTCRRRRRESLRDLSNHNSPVVASPSKRTKSPCVETHWMPTVQKRRSGDDIWADNVKRKKPCTTDHVINLGSTPASADGHLCVSMSPTEEPVQLLHKDLPRLPQRPADDLCASRLIDQFVDQIRMEDCTFIDDAARDRLSIVSPLAKRLAEIRLRKSSPLKRKWSDSHVPPCKRPNLGALTLPDSLPSPFTPHSVVPPSPITPCRRDPDESDDYWKTPVGPVIIAGDSLSTTSSKTVEDDIICCDPKSPTMLDETFTLKSRRCLSFVSPVSDSPAKRKNRRSIKKNSDKASGLEVSISLKDSTHLNVQLKRGRNLVCSDGEPPNTYIKVYLVPGKGTCHRTRVRHYSSNPRFDESFSVPLSEEDTDKRILISAWHRNLTKRRSEFLGYMSFAVKNIMKKEVNGTFKLVPQSPGRMPPHSTPAQRPQDLTVIRAVQCSEDEEDIMIDDDPTPSNYNSVSIKSKSNQKVSKKETPISKTSNEENKFLQYLELDPPLTSRDGRCGRTPFTVTKRLTKSPGSSFGFSIAWTHPPRVERVECGLPADQADLKPGDYVVFINKTNVVMMSEDDIMDLIKSCGNQLFLEVYNKTSTTNRKNQPPPRSTSTPGVLNLAASAVSQSDTTMSLQEPPRRRFHIPQVTFTSENLLENTDLQLKWIHQLLTAEQQLVLCLQFGIGRYLLPLAERKDVLKPKEHTILFQNVQELLRITEDTLERIIDNDWKQLARNMCKVYVNKIDQINTAYYKYCKGIIRADSLLVEKSQNTNFLNLIKDPPIPERRPDLITFLHKPLEHYRNILKCMQLIQINSENNQDDFEALSHIVHEMQATYRFITVESGLMEPDVDGKPLLSLNDLETRLVFTRCKPFILNVPDRQWIFAGDLSRVEGRSVRSYWALLFSDILMFTKVSRDRVLFVTDDPLPLSSISQTQFSVKKKDAEFRLVINSNVPVESPHHNHPAMTGCSPLFADLSGTLSRLPSKIKGRVIVLRAPKPELKAVWQNLIQRQILALNKSSILPTNNKCNNTSLATLDSPDDLLANSLATLDDGVSTDRLKSLAVSLLIDEKCLRLSKTTCNKAKALHISQWIKGELKSAAEDEPECDVAGSENELDDFECWTEEQMNIKKAEIQRRIRSRDECEEEFVSTETFSIVSSPDDSQKTVVPINVCDKCQKPCDNNNDNRYSDTFLDFNEKLIPKDCISNSSLNTCKQLDIDRNNNGSDKKNQQKLLQEHQYYFQPQTAFQPLEILSDKYVNQNISTDSLDKAEYCSTTDYRQSEDFCPITNCCLPVKDDKYSYDASSEEFWGTPNSSTTSPLSAEMDSNEKFHNSSHYIPIESRVISKINKRPSCLELLNDELDSSDNTPSYEYKKISYGEGKTLLNPKSRSLSLNRKNISEKQSGKNIFNKWKLSKITRKRSNVEVKSSSSYVRKRNANKIRKM
ncbi:uncharacterized protein LOC126902449 isoform X2 [Daktulosphaira vitifoliae]|uniref:uncharacterized protein LOC126902449 isoform X2 n=1 Tax=Daktulosphaira vitifoliae TaxID=58002 RepID=UPI0021A9F824|nr:uncharacterized protein LOC126902449 isoform X2 [Daktulosphaira vitifoliae]